MRQPKPGLWFIWTSSVIAGCTTNNHTDTDNIITQSLILTSSQNITDEGVLEYDSIVFGENPTTFLEAGAFHSYKFDGKALGNVTITMTSPKCGIPDTVLYLFGPEDTSGNRGASMIENDDAFLGPCSLNSQIKSFNLPTDGTYLIVATSFQQTGAGNYKLQLTCNNNACTIPCKPTLAGTRILQTDIDRGVYRPEELFKIGDFMFKTVYRVEDGMGNGLTGAPANSNARPNLRSLPNNVHFANFGAPEAQSCVTCHNIGGDDGAGDLKHNTFQLGNGLNRSSGLARNPPSLLGSGLRQRLGEEMTNDLQSLLESGKAQAATTHTNVTVTLRSKNINFGSVVAKPDGTIDFTLLSPGIDTDLIVKPFGWKGQEATLRRFIENSLRVHFGMQTQPSVDGHCLNPNVNKFGYGSDCHDPDGDGVINEITEGQLSAAAVYVGLLETPVRTPAGTPAAQARVNQGEILFKSIGCEGCHHQNVTINVPVHVEPADTTRGAGITLHLDIDTHKPHPNRNVDGSMTVELWSDFKRHDMGTGLADSKAFNQIKASQFTTPPLWGVADSAPYLHDGRAPTLKDAILTHGGEAIIQRNSYTSLSTDDQQKILEFLSTLRRTEDLGPETLPLTPLQCHIEHDFPASTSNAHSLLTGDCPITGCGLNGVWLGSGVPFRTLHLTSGRANDSKLEILYTTGPIVAGGPTKQLNIDVQDDKLYGTPINGGSKVEAMPGWRIVLGKQTSCGPREEYDLLIAEIKQIDFWAQLPEARERFPAYRFTATSLTDGCNVEICSPRLSDDNGFPGISGTAVIFRGDLYDEMTYTVQSTPSDLNNNDSDVINIACLGSTISKLHLLRHTSASHPAPISPPNDLMSENQTMLKLLTADYCGIGHPFTIDGVLVKIGFNNSFYKLTDESLYNFQAPTPARSIDALWRKDGAACIDTPRYRQATGTGPDLTMIQEFCNAQYQKQQLPPRTIQACTSPVSFDNQFILNNNAISGNP